jgi:AcrR family transcriptional regulator
MSTGPGTRRRILLEAVRLTRLEGLQALSIGRLAAATGLSKAGLFRHFGSKTALQLAVLEASVDAFRNRVIVPALRAPSGLARLERLLDAWLEWTAGGDGGCPLLGASVELDDQPGALREYLVDKQRAWLDCVRAATRRALTEGAFAADLDVEQFAFEFNAIGLSFNFSRRLLEDAAADARARSAWQRLVASAAAGRDATGDAAAMRLRD